MDKFVRRLSVGLARTSSRRSFLGGAVKGAVTAGIGAIAFFAGERPSFALDCDAIAGENYDCLAPGTSCGSLLSTNGDGCSRLFSYCDNSAGTYACPPGYNATGSWVCCCDGHRSRCTDCSLSSNTSQLCIQQGNGGPC